MLFLAIFEFKKKQQSLKISDTTAFSRHRQLFYVVYQSATKDLYT